MKKIYLLLLLIVSAGYSQENQIDVTLNKSKLFKEVKNWEIKALLQADDNSIFSIRTITTRMFTEKTTYLFNKFDAAYNKVLSYEYKPKKNHAIGGAIVRENSFSFVEYQKDRKNKRIIVYLHSSPLNTFNFKRKKLFSLAIDKFPNFFDGIFSSRKMDSNTGGNLSFSENGEFAVFNIDSYSKKEEKHLIIVLNSDLEELWRRDFKLPIADNRFELENIKIANDGNVFVLGKSFPKKKKRKKNRKKGERKYHYELISVTENQSRNIQLSVEDHYVGSLDLTFTNDNKIGCLGFYSDKNDFRYKGVCSFFVEPNDLTLISKNFSPFTGQFIRDKYGKAKAKELSNISIRDIHYTDSGNIIFTAEEYFMTVITTYVNGIPITTYTYSFNDILIINTDASGQLNWARNINKKQSSGNYYDPLLSFSSVINNKEEVFLFLNAHKKMGELSGDRTAFRQNWLFGITKKNSKMYVVKFDTNGNWNFKDIQENKTSKTIINSRFVKMLSDNKAVFYGSHRKNKQFIEITFN